MNKKGQLTPIIYIIGGLIAIILLSVAAMIGWGTVKTFTDEFIPEINQIGEVAPGNNLSEYSAVALAPVDSVVGNFGLVIGLIYIIEVVGILALAFLYRNNQSGWLIALFVMSLLFLIMIAVFVSQTYEEFYLDQGELGAQLRSASLASFLIINSPVILTIVGFIAGIIMFTGGKEDAFGI